jgi:hypothetical protein
MDWALAVDKNRMALTRIVAEIFALLGLVAGHTVERLPHGLYLAAERLLHPAESALRRLIVIAARGLVLQPASKRPMPQGLVIESKGSKAMAFRLFDQRKSFDFNAAENAFFVKVETYSNNPLNLFNSIDTAQPAERLNSAAATGLCRRLAALSHALENLPQQVRRLARWNARRKLMVKPKFTAAIRPGPPPGHCKKPSCDVDYILQECHWLAWDCSRVDSS